MGSNAPRNKASSLDYSTDADPGIARDIIDGAVIYRGPSGRIIRASRTLKRIERLVIPPAWVDVWICPSSKGHIQATGKDARGRKQYRYHPQWIAERDSNKFDSLLEFGLALPRLRRRVNRDLSLPRLSKARVLAAIVQLMDRVFIRVGGERYRRENGSFGVTTLRNRHVKIEGSDIYLDFRGKSGKRHQLALDDRRVASVVRRCLDLPGAALFQYRESEEIRTVSASDVNEYLRSIAGASLTSKDFRTWGGTVCAAQFLARMNRGASLSDQRLAIRQAAKAASQLLGNTPAVCRRSYIHPVVFASHEAGFVAAPKRIAGLRASENLVMALLEQHRKGAALDTRRHDAYPATEPAVGQLQKESSLHQ